MAPAQVGRFSPTDQAPSPSSETGMDLNEVRRRIFKQHWRLILLCVGLVVAVVGLALFLRGSNTYTASARLILDTQDPKSRSESTSIADTAKAIATSPSQVRAALQQAQVTHRDPLQIAKHDVSIQALGTSAVLELSVSDRDRHVAAALTNALAERVIRARLAVSNGQLQQILTQLQQGIDELNTKIATLDAETDSVTIRLANAASATKANALRSQRDSLSRSRDLFVEQRGIAESERVSLLSADAVRPKPSIISAATVPAHANSSHFLSYVTLGILLGLILGVGCAGILELIRPTLVGSEAVARTDAQLEGLFEMPKLLGTLPKETDANASRALRAIGARLRLAAKAAGVETIGVVHVGRETDLEDVAAGLERAASAAIDPHHAAFADGRARPGLAIGALGFEELMDERGRGLGLVAAGPAKLNKADLMEFRQFLRMTSLPVLGFVACSRRSTNEWRRSWESQASSALARRNSTLDSPDAG